MLYEQSESEERRMNEIQRELNAGNVAFRNGLIMQWMPYISSIVKRHSIGERDDLHNAIAYKAKHEGTYNGSCHIAGWIKLCALGGLRTAYMRKKIDTVGGDAVSYCKTLDTPRSELSWHEYKLYRRRAIKEAMAKLSIREHYLITQRFLERRKIKDLAEEEDMVLMTLHYQIIGILKRMRASIEHYYDDLR